MSVFQTLLNSGKLLTRRKSFNLSSTACRCLIKRKQSDVAKKFVTFDELVAQRRAEARRSAVVQVNSEASFTELYGYCSKYANVNGIHHYKNSEEEHFMLIEFSTEDNLKELLQSCAAHQKDQDVMALKSPFLWFRASTDKKKFNIPEGLSLVTTNCEMEVNEELLMEKLALCSTMSQQIQMLYDCTMLNDLSVRLRYMVARQLECIYESMYANIAVYPFGSSVNGFGKLGCDLDLVLTNTLTDDMCSLSKRLIYQEKKETGARWQRHLALVAEGLELRAVGASRVTRVLHARVPIVKFCHQLACLDCDLCYNNMSGVYMSELLHSLHSLDARVAPLTLAVRRWARAAGLTSPHPGRWITNYPLTVMVLFYLQAVNILPDVNTIVTSAGKEDLRIAEDNINCTFLRDLNKLPKESYGQNDASLETLLLQFFEFYAQFDFQNKAISINEGKPIRKPNALPLYIVNPLEKSANVSRNVSYEESERLKTEVRNAAWQLEETNKQKSEDWGIMSLMEGKSIRGLKKLLKVGNSHRLVSVKDLFRDDDDNAKRLTENSSDKEKKRPMKFKNSQIANEVFRIRRNKMV